jgi:hypothetical protein
MRSRKGLLLLRHLTPETVDVDLIESDIDFAESIPEYNILFTGLVGEQTEMSFLDIITGI